MPDLRQQLAEILQGRVCLVGVGNVDQGDDGVGLRLAANLAKSEIRNPKSEINPRSEENPNSESTSKTEVRGEDVGLPQTLLAGSAPERHLGFLIDANFDTVVFLDAVEFGGAPGSVILLEAEEITARFPQVSTHKLSLGLLAGMIEANGRTRVHLLGVQPQSLEPGAALSPAVQATVALVTDLLRRVLRRPCIMLPTNAPDLTDPHRPSAFCLLPSAFPC